MLILLPACAAAQTQITIGASTSGTVEFSGAGQTQGTFVGSCGPADCIQGDAHPGSNVGAYSMWITGNVAPLDFTIALPQGGSLVSQGEGLRSASISSAGILTSPEPATIALIGSGLLAIGGVLKRRKRR
jgi:hypothetical protein